MRSFVSADETDVDVSKHQMSVGNRGESNMYYRGSLEVANKQRMVPLVTRLCIALLALSKCEGSAAFQLIPSPRLPSSAADQGAFRKRYLPSASKQDVRLQTSPLPDGEASRDIAVDPDQARRRQLLLSMFAAASSVSMIPPNVAQAGTLLENPRTETMATADFLDILKPPLDDREYVAYTLENGLRVLLCSDESSNEAAVALDVHVGACSDPAEVPGMAHFNEHMLFLGTKKYPKEDSFEAFLASNGGSSNAYTASEDTVYFFDMAAEANAKFAEGLSRFGAFFTAPLFTEGATGRELNAIESENAKNLQSDTFRIFQIDKSRANPDHPYSKFFTGNKKTLLDDTKAKGLSLREELIKFYNNYYSANQMTLAIVAPQSIGDLKNMVTEAFLDIPNRNVDTPESSWAGIPPFIDESSIPSFKNAIEIVPVQDLRQIMISWPIVYSSEDQRQDDLLNKPTTYIAHLLGHEGPRSLLSYLKSRGWANSVGCANSEELSDFEVFEVVVGLTTQGLAQVDEVVESVYAYINMLRDRKIPNYVFEEVFRLEELQWRFLTKGSPRSYASSLSTAMQKYPPELYVAGPRRLALDEFIIEKRMNGLARSEFVSREALERSRKQAELLADNLTVDNALLTVMSKDFDNKTDRKEKWYGTDYRVRPLSVETLSRWRRGIRAEQIKIDFPRPNPFIPTEQGLRVKISPSGSMRAAKRSFESRMMPVPPPSLLRDDGPDGRWKVYFKADDRFGLPKGYIVFQVVTGEAFASPRSAALSNLFEVSIADKIGEYAYDASLAGLTYDVKIMPRGIRLTFGGYNDKLKRFASYISLKLTTEIRDVLPTSESVFDRYKDQVMRGLSAFDVKQPYFHASYYSQIALQPPRFQYDNTALREATREVNLSDLIDYVNTLWKSGRGEALIQGNFDQKEAMELVKNIGDVLPFRPIVQEEYPSRLEALPLPAYGPKKLPTKLIVAEPNPDNENSVATVMLQSLGTSEKDHVLIELISSIVQEPFYNELRTKKQLGYIVSSGIRAVGNSRTLSFIVQSSVAPADKLSIEIVKFLNTVEDRFLNKLLKADLAVYVKSLIDRKTEPDKELATEVTRNWAEIASGRFQFDRIQREAAALLDVQKEDLLDFWRRIYTGDNCRVLVTQVVPRQGPASSPVPAKSTGYNDKDPLPEGLVLGIDDLDQFRADRQMST